MVRYLAREPQNIEQGISNVEGPCRRVATKSRENARKAAETDVDRGRVSQQIRAAAVRGCWWLFVTLPGNHSPLTLRNSTFLVRRSPVPHESSS